MPRISKLSSLKIEKSNGTLTDLTPFVKSVDIKPYKPSIWKRIYIWFYWKYFQFKINRSWKRLSKTKIQIEFERRIKNPWKWN